VIYNVWTMAVIFGIILGLFIDNVGLGIALGSTIHKEDSSSEEE